MIFLRLLLLLLLTTTNYLHSQPNYRSYNPKELVPFKQQKKQWESIPSKTIVIDPGHGGKDNGAHSTKSPPYKEKDLNLATAKHLQRYLQKLGYRVIMTRSEDHAVDLQERASYANQIKCDLFVSVHYNSAPNQEANGIEVYFYQSKETPQRTQASEKLAQYTLNGIIEKTEAKARGVRKGNFAVIRETKMPAILVEGGFLTNSTERENILNQEYRKKVALGIAQGIEHYFAAQKLARLQD